MSTLNIFVVSDATGETAEKVVHAALLQFPSHKARVRVFTRVKDESTARDVLNKAADSRALVVCTLVDPALRDLFYRYAVEGHVEVVDVIASLITKLSDYLKAAPLNVSSVNMPLSEDYFRRVEAIEFAVKSDDGREPRNLSRADIVLVGVSRTSKTPLSTYLAGRGLKVANVPLVLGVDPPQELFDDVDEERVVALTIEFEQLVGIRKARLQQLGMAPTSEELLRRRIREEIDCAEQLMSSHPKWTRVDVSGRAIEEIAATILEMYKQQQEARGRSVPPLA